MHLETRSDAHYLDGKPLTTGCRIEWFGGQRWWFGQYVRDVEGAAWFETTGFGALIKREDELRWPMVAES